MNPETKNYNLIFIIIFILIFAIRFYHLSFFEFKDDQLNSIIKIGNQTRNAKFLVTHGPISGIGIDIPPFYPYFMGLLTMFTEDPLYITAVFAILNFFALVLALQYFYKQLPLIYAILSSVILAFSPAFTIYAGYIWQQCLLPIFIIIFYTILTRFLKYKEAKYFVLLVIIISIAAQLYFAAFFIFPLIILIAIFYRREIGIKYLALAIFCALILFLPYLYYLFFERGLAKIISYSTAQRSVYWKIFRQHIRMASFDFFRYYFRYDFNAVLSKSIGFLKFILYPLSCILMIFFVIGFLSHLGWIIRKRRLFDTTEEVLAKYPLPFQIAGSMTLTVTITYLLLKVQTPPHYLIVLFPAYSILTGFAAYRLWNFFWVRIITWFSIISTAILLVSILLFLKKAGGHPHEYGPSYQEMLNWRKEILARIGEGECLQLELIGDKKFDIDTINYVILNGHYCHPADKVKRAVLRVEWDKTSMSYKHFLGIVSKNN